jgi:ParB-like chromosome segregation protein Spo0J
MDIQISKVIVGNRRRKDYGDISELAESIKKYGLIHPIVIDGRNNLVAGGRRLAACKSLGMAMIPFTYVMSEDDNEKKIVELEENIRRKDLTELEASKNIIEYAKVKADDKAVGVRPLSERDMAKSAGVAKTTLHDAKAHVSAVEKYPELKEHPKYEAIKISKELDNLPDELKKDYTGQIDRLQQEKKELQEQLKDKKNEAEAYKDHIKTFQGGTKDFKSIDIINFQYSVRDFMKAVSAYVYLGEQFSLLKQAERDKFLEEIQTIERWTMDIRQAIAGNSGGANLIILEGANK